MVTSRLYKLKFAVSRLSIEKARSSAFSLADNTNLFGLLVKSNLPFA